MELYRKTLTSATWWSLVIFNLLTFSSCKNQPESTVPSWKIKLIANSTSHVTYLVDLERAIDHILRVQLVQVPVFKGKELIVLQNIMALLDNFNPLYKYKKGKANIKNINRFIKSQTEVSQEYFKGLANDDEFATENYIGDDYIGCLGSQSGLRGFNCSLWNLFHYWTVQSSFSPELFQPGAVLWTLHGYVHHFMNCSECYLNFWFYVQEHQIEDVKTHDEEILWLWRAHNYFNRKLAGDVTEDPWFPKKQFPEDKYCRKCRWKGKWQNDKVLKYLKNIYSSISEVVGLINKEEEP
ncbi:sulfhydryl oxidase 2-like [Drosophila kikkawai]|uniref:Sulfhydryl oxidase n=1 Tax=Drosophila kikkawai TaxID=30033 RepID=A0A6P4HX97_DROKI|nr:sulfhydryl oxidase 2-like [Drosophila kikkawai]